MTSTRLHTKEMQTPNVTPTQFFVKTWCGRFDGLTAIALIVIGALVLTGHLNSIVAGSTAIGLASLSIIANIAQGRKTREGYNRTSGAIIDAIISISIIVIAALALKGILPVATLGKVIIGTAAALFVLKCVNCCRRGTIRCFGIIGCTKLAKFFATSAGSTSYSRARSLRTRGTEEESLTRGTHRPNLKTHTAPSGRRYVVEDLEGSDEESDDLPTRAFRQKHGLRTYTAPDGRRYVTQDLDDQDGEDEHLNASTLRHRHKTNSSSSRVQELTT